MLHFTIIMEDLAVVVSRDTESWKGVMTDTFKGETENVNWTDEEFCAILTLANGADEEKWHGYFVPALYEVAEAALKRTPTVRPIP